ncbi:phosphatidylserine decarboxylase [Lachnotalea glycerini]|uniref:Phosphatidylserine decarboxylase n=1 Tax=Lachnotalea glycerini TaxID=1763509 RepID=A0A318EGA4_9FIRM|nr:phosphatidylserine decarboxylase [Lachnotalea glycerini]PXV84759.1 phosphatidylserine decarboxylase [Lachnotalea glycerini]
MKSVDRNGYEIKQNETQNQMLGFLYQNKIGRIILSQLVKPWVSKAMGILLNLSVSKWLIGSFVKKNDIDLSEYEDRKYRSYNDFFTRKIKEGHRKIDEQPEHLIAPCDSKLSVYSISADARFKIKDTLYTMESLLRSKKLATHYEGGLLLIFRLTVDDYHRFCYTDNGVKTKNYKIPGVYHTVNPLANDVIPIYKENTREFSIIKSENFGNILTMEVGALLVGRIVNYHEKANVRRGEEKGKFEFGGSTIILCLEKGRVIIDEDILANSLNGVETVVKMGEKIGIA